MCSIIGVGERLHKVLGQIDLGTLDSGERSLPFGLLVLVIASPRKLLDGFDEFNTRVILDEFITRHAYVLQM